MVELGGSLRRRATALGLYLVALASPLTYSVLYQAFRPGAPDTSRELLATFLSLSGAAIVVRRLVRKMDPAERESHLLARHVFLAFSLIGIAPFLMSALGVPGRKAALVTYLLLAPPVFLIYKGLSPPTNQIAAYHVSLGVVITACSFLVHFLAILPGQPTSLILDGGVVSVYVAGVIPFMAIILAWLGSSTLLPFRQDLLARAAPWIDEGRALLEPNFDPQKHDLGVQVPSWAGHPPGIAFISVMVGLLCAPLWYTHPSLDELLGAGIRQPFWLLVSLAVLVLATLRRGLPALLRMAGFTWLSLYVLSHSAGVGLPTRWNVIPPVLSLCIVGLLGALTLLRRRQDGLLSVAVADSWSFRIIHRDEDLEWSGPESRPALPATGWMRYPTGESLDGWGRSGLFTVILCIGAAPLLAAMHMEATAWRWTHGVGSGIATGGDRLAAAQALHDALMSKGERVRETFSGRAALAQASYDLERHAEAAHWARLALTARCWDYSGPGADVVKLRRASRWQSELAGRGAEELRSRRAQGLTTATISDAAFIAHHVGAQILHEGSRTAYTSPSRRYDVALQHLLRAASLAPDHSGVWTDMGTAATQLVQRLLPEESDRAAFALEMARRARRKVLSETSREPPFTHTLMVELINWGELAAARDLCELISASGGGRGELCQGLLAYRSGRLKEAIQHCRKALVGTPLAQEDRLRVQLLLAVCLARRGALGEARRVLYAPAGGARSERIDLARRLTLVLDDFFRRGDDAWTPEERASRETRIERHVLSSASGPVRPSAPTLRWLDPADRALLE